MESIYRSCLIKCESLTHFRTSSSLSLASYPVSTASFFLHVGKKAGSGETGYEASLSPYKIIVQAKFQPLENATLHIFGMLMNYSAEQDNE